MTMSVRPELSKDNKYWIDKHRYYELKHFCLQYPTWKSAYYTLGDANISHIFMSDRRINKPGDPTAKKAMLKMEYSKKMSLVECIALETDSYLHSYILKAVTENLSYNHMRTKYNIPCGRDMYYDRYRRFFWLLDKSRE